MNFCSLSFVGNGSMPAKFIPVPRQNVKYLFYLEWTLLGLEVWRCHHKQWLILNITTNHSNTVSNSHNKPLIAAMPTTMLISS